MRATGAVRTVAVTFAAVALLGCDASEARPQTTQSAPVEAFSGELSAALRDAIDAWAATPSHRGVSAAVVLANGEEWVSAAGQHTEEADLTPEHLIWIASITKTVTGAVILGLAEEGVLGLDDPVSRWLDPVPNVDPRITLRQLLNHTNGLANYTANPDLQPAIDRDDTHVFSAEELMGLVGPRVFDRGARTQYTNTAFVLLGLVAEAATGEGITELYRKRLWEPLGLEEVFLPGIEDPAGPVATAWAGNGADVEIAPLEHMSLITIGNSGFGLFSNARTVARWGHSLFTNQVFGPEMREQMLQVVPAAGNIPGESGAGLGIRTYRYLGRTQWGHSGGSPLGSSLMLYDPDTGVTVAVIMNQGRGAEHFALAPGLLEIVTR